LSGLPVYPFTSLPVYRFTGFPSVIYASD
jgi:hypothetical protein